jgi:poly(3-hydroxybutyrate) depolymerase
MNFRTAAIMMLLLPLAAGCLVTQPQDTPVPALKCTDVQSGQDYWLYVPSYYDDSTSWPLVITLHGTHLLDGSKRQINEWKVLAERKGFIVAAPALKSVQGVLPVSDGLWQKDLQSDERTIISLEKELQRRYRIRRGAVILTGFSAGGYPMYYTGLRHPDRFDMLIARGCNSSMAIFEDVPVTDEARQMPIAIFWGKDDMGHIQEQSWQAFRWLREHRFFGTERREVEGGHLRRPEVAWSLWEQRGR